MMPYRKQGGRTYYLTLATGDDAPLPAYVRPSSGTRDKSTADQMQAMLDLVGERGKRLLWIRDAIIAKRVKVPVVYDHYLAGTLEDLKASLADVDLRPQVDAWRADLDQRVKDGTLAAETVRKYKEQAEQLVGDGEPVWRSTITVKHIRAALQLVPGSGTNRRRHAEAWKSLFDFCVEAEQLEANPVRQMKLPKSNRARERWIEWEHAMALIQRMPAGPHRALAALRHGAGHEMTAALPLRRRDVVDVAEQIVWAHGKKNTHRDRQAPVLDDACWRIFWEYVSTGGFLPDAPLFPVTAREHARVQRDAYDALRAELAERGGELRADYKTHASRSTYAVEMLRRGHEPKLIATGGLGHANERLLLTLYGKFRQTKADVIASKRRAQGAAG